MQCISRGRYIIKFCSVQLWCYRAHPYCHRLQHSSIRADSPYLIHSSTWHSNYGQKQDNFHFIYTKCIIEKIFMLMGLNVFCFSFNFKCYKFCLDRCVPDPRTSILGRSQYLINSVTATIWHGYGKKAHFTGIKQRCTLTI